MQERRSGPRVGFSGWVELTTPQGRLRGSACDLSVGGIGVEVPSRAPGAPTRITSEFALPGISLPLALEGEISWSDPASGRVGVRFRAVDPGVSELLESFVAGRF